MYVSKKYQTFKKLYIGLLIAAVALQQPAIASLVHIGDVQVFIFQQVAYTGMLMIWALSINQRIISRAISLYLMHIDGLLICWLLLRASKYRFYWEEPFVIRMIWYLYFAIIIVIAMFLLFVAVATNRVDVVRHRWMGVKFATTALVVLVLSNDYHELVFVFKTKEKVTTDMGFGPGFWFIVAWLAGMLIMSLVIMIINGNREYIGRKAYFPAFWLVVLALYLLYYYHFAPIFTSTKLMELPEALSVIVMLFVESAISSGLLVSNLEYGQFFNEASISAFITDDKDEIRYSAGAVSAVAKDNYALAKEDAVFLDETTKLKCSSVRGGYVYWTEDLTEYNRLNEELEEVREILLGENDLLIAENKTLEQKARIDARNDLYDEIDLLVHPQLVKIDDIINSTTVDADNYVLNMKRVCVLDAYVKRRINLVLVREDLGKIPPNELELCFRESAQYLKLMEVDCAIGFECIDEEIDSYAIMKIYDYFELVVETLTYRIKQMLINITLTSKEQVLRMVVNIDAKDMNDEMLCIFANNPLIDNKTRIKVDMDEDEIYINLSINGGLANE